MKKLILTFITLLNYLRVNSQVRQIDKVKLEEDLDGFPRDISESYIYLKDKSVDLNCIREYYRSQIGNIKTEEEIVLLFEYLLDEFYDNHLSLNTNRKSSYRLYSPIHVNYKNGNFLNFSA